MNYTPNFNDPRVIERITHAIGFALGVMSTDKPRPWSTRYIDKHLGQSQRPLSQYLRSKLLICTNERYSKDQHTCKEYVLNQSGLNELKEKLSSSSQEHLNHKKMDKVLIKNNSTTIYPSVSEVTYDQIVVKRFLKKEYQSELTSGEFKYKAQSNRLWHGLQSVKNEYRAPILSEYGYTYNYDIESCAPTLLLQHSRHLGNDLWLPKLDYYLKNKNEIRNGLGKRAELDPRQVKVLINALFCGARLGNNKQFAISQLLEHDKAKIMYLQQDEFLTELRQEIKTIWSYITPYMSRRRNTKSNRLKPVSSRDKWNVYFRLESQVMTSIRQFINQNKIKCFLEHDGWVCNEQIDVNQLTKTVESQTGFQIKLKLEKRNNSTTIYPSVSEVGNTG